MRVLKTALTITAKGGLSVLFAVILVLGVLALDKNFNLVSKLTGSPQVAAISSPALSNKFCDDPASESQTGCTSFIPSVLAAASAPYQTVSGDVNISGTLYNNITSNNSGAFFGGSIGGNNQSILINPDTANGANISGCTNPDGTTAHPGDGCGRIILQAGPSHGVEFLTSSVASGAHSWASRMWIGQNGRVGIGTNNPAAPLTVNAINNQAIRVENGGSSGRITFVATNNSNLWNIDNIEGKMRFFREDYSASGYGANGVIKMTIDNDGVKFACRTGFWAVADGRICVEQTLRGPNSAWDAIGTCKGVGPGSRVCTHNDLQQACGSGISNPYGTSRGWYGDHGVASGGNWDDEYGAWNSNGCANNNDDPAYSATSISLPYRCCY